MLSALLTIGRHGLDLRDRPSTPTREGRPLPRSCDRGLDRKRFGLDAGGSLERATQGAVRRQLMAPAMTLMRPLSRPSWTAILNQLNC